MGHPCPFVSKLISIPNFGKTAKQHLRIPGVLLYNVTIFPPSERPDNCKCSSREEGKAHFDSSISAGQSHLCQNI